MADLRHIIRVPSSLKKERAIDGNEHTATRILPAATLGEENLKAFAKAIEEYLTTNKALAAGEDANIIRSDGASKTVKTTDTDDLDGSAKVFRTGLPLTFGDIIDLVNAAVEQKHRNQIGAALTAKFDKKNAEKSTRSDKVTDTPDLDDIN